MVTANLTQERAARRFHQIATLERQLSNAQAALVSCNNQLKDLKEQRDGLVARIRIAARDEGELPLFNLDGE